MHAKIELIFGKFIRIQFDVRKDEEQDVKLEDTIRLLLAAGYFRARIKSLSPFDKVPRPWFSAGFGVILVVLWHVILNIDACFFFRLLGA